MRISLAVVAVLLLAGSAQAQGAVKKRVAWTRPAPVVVQTQSISNSSLRYYGGPKGERGLAMPSER
ncbi:MAG: hypothetical protein JO289_22465 [Xanthobacteraceae bacterium]|nr:hypothetical protein [Xanthobacteraceae bacterium]